MTDKEKLEKVRAEIERRKKEVIDNIFELGNSESERIGLFDRKEIYDDLLSFIDSMEKESASEDLEEAANNAVIALVPSFGQKYSDGSYVSSCRDSFKREELIELFKAGANWQERKDEKNIGELQWNAHAEGWDECKQEMMKDAIDTTIKQGCTELGILIKGLDEDKFSFGDKIKVLIIKED